MAYVNVAEWKPDHVADWLRGLEDEIQPYTQFFVNNKVNGCQLLTLARDDLTNLNMTKIGHQELVLEAVELLRQLHYNLTSETLQSLALKLGCKAQSLFNDLKRVCQDFADSGKKERVSVETLSGVSDIINLVKSLISWLDRYPFVGQENYVDVRKTILKLSVELASTAQRDQFAENPHKIIKETCLKLAAQSDKIVQDFNDSLIIQPASLEVAKIKRKVDDDLGIHINSLYTGIHVIEDVKFQSPAYRSGKVEEGDEIVQVNYQTVIGWQIKNIICAMKEHPTEVHLTLKKRPRHPNVLGQVITLWPYRIPSKKTAFRKLYKWNKGKDIRELCPKSPGARGEANSVSEVNGGLSEKEKLFAVNKPRNRLRRRATVTGVSPTALHAPVSLEELIGNNSKRKESVLRTISYDPNKTIDLEDNVFKKENPQSCTQEDKGETQSSESKAKSDSLDDKDISSPKSNFLRPPQEKFMTGHLKRQEALKNSETVARAGVAVPSFPPLSTSSNCAPPKPPHRTVAQPQNHTSNDVNALTQEAAPCGSQSPKQKFAEWVNKQKKKPEVGILQHALTLFSQDSNAQPLSPKESGSPRSPKYNTGSPKVKKTSGTIFQFPFREGRPSLSELRSLKRTANSKVFSERVSSTTVDKSVTSPKQNTLNKHNQMQHKRPGVGSNFIKQNGDLKSELGISTTAWQTKQSNKITDNYIHPKAINYAKIPQYPYEMHESKIVSLKPKTQGNNYPTVPDKQSLPVASHPPRTNLHYQRARQASKLTSQATSTLLRNQKSSYPAAFYSPSGRSLSFNNIAMSSDDSSSEEYEGDEDLSDEAVPHRHQDNMQNRQPAYPGMDPVFARQVAEVYNLLSQRQNFLQSQVRTAGRSQLNTANSAVIDELALRMYHALRVNHMQSQNSYQQAPTQPRISVPKQNLVAKTKPVPFQNGGINIPQECIQGERYSQSHLEQKNSSYPYHMEHHISENNCINVVHEHPVDLPPSAYLPSRNINPIFKSATSQEIHNLYTSQVSNKGSVSTPLENEKNMIYMGESERDHMYETIPYDKSKNKVFDDSDNLEKKNIIMQPERLEEKNFIYPAEKELEHLPCKDNKDKNQFYTDRISEVVTDCAVNTKLKNNVFCPIKENDIPNSKSFENVSAFRPVAVSHKRSINTENNISNSKPENFESNNQMNGMGFFLKNVQPAISSLMINIPKPPTEAYTAATTKCSSSQTDTELCDSSIVKSVPDVKPLTILENSELCLNNDDSFISNMNNTNNSITESPTYASSSSSLNSSSSGSTISSSGSCYYYVETQIKPQFTIKFPSVTSENGEETPLIDLRSPTLPTMGISMLSKKRSTSSSGSEQGSNAGSRASPSVTAGMESDVAKPPRIVTDVEHTI